MLGRYVFKNTDFFNLIYVYSLLHTTRPLYYTNTMHGDAKRLDKISSFFFHWGHRIFKNLAKNSYYSLINENFKHSQLI